MRPLLRTALIVSGALLISAATWSVFRYGVVTTDTGLPVLGQVPEFSLIDSDGRRCRRRSLPVVCGSPTSSSRTAPACVLC